MTFVKPNKDPTRAASDVPIILLYTLFSKRTPNTHTQNHSHSSLTHPILIQTKPLHHHTHNPHTKTPLKASTIENHQNTLFSPQYTSVKHLIHSQNWFTNQILNTNVHNNTRHWLANDVSCRQSSVIFNGKSSRTRYFRNRLPQGWVLFPTHCLICSCTTFHNHPRTYK